MEDRMGGNEFTEDLVGVRGGTLLAAFGGGDVHDESGTDRGGLVVPFCTERAC